MTRPDEIIYIAIPYSHPDWNTRIQRFRIATAWAAFLMTQENPPIVYSPITHSHPMAELYDLPKEFEFWKRQDLHFLNTCTTVHVLAVEGWDKSVGLKEEIAYAERIKKIISYINPDVIRWKLGKTIGDVA